MHGASSLRLGIARRLTTSEGFDYTGVPTEKVQDVRDASARIKVRMSRTAQDIIEIGRDLIAVKKLLGHGNFLPWIEAEFGMSRHTADNFVHVCERFSDKLLTVSNLPPTILYALAAPSTPEPVREAAVERVRAGCTVTAPSRCGPARPAVASRPPPPGTPPMRLALAVPSTRGSMREAEVELRRQTWRRH